MSDSMRRIITRLRAQGITVHEMPGWAGRCRCHSGPHSSGGPTIRGRGWYATRSGLTAHITTSPRHTGAKAVAYTENILIGGNGSVPGPLCQWAIDGDGRIIVVAAGRSNHVGEVGKGAEAAALTGAFNNTAYDTRWQGEAVDGNTVFDGFEILSGPGPSAVQRAAAVALSAEWCRENKRPAHSVHGHGEVADSRGYSDPGMPMGKFRQDTAAEIGRLNAQGNTPTPAPPAPPRGLEDMKQSEFNALMDGWAQTTAAKDWLKVNALGGTHGIDVQGDGKNESAGSLIAEVYQQLDRLGAKLDRLGGGGQA